jgi:hypothetical protein
LNHTGYFIRQWSKIEVIFASTEMQQQQPVLPLEDRLKKALTESLKTDLKLKQCTNGYIRLPVVPKRLYRGIKGALYYINPIGKKVFLNGRQKDALNRQSLPGVVGVPPLPMDARPARIRQPRRRPNMEDGVGLIGGPGNPTYNPDQIPRNIFAQADRLLDVARRL